MAYLIDGHNLIGQLPDISLADPDDEAKLVIKLRGFSARTGKKVIVIFDNGMPAGYSHLSNGTVEVVFASPGSTADAIMISRIRTARDPGYWVVVSGDRAVLDAAQRRKMRAVRSADFVRELNAPVIPKTDKDSEPFAVTKGKSRRKSAHIPDPHVSAKEVEEWLRIFGEKDG